MQPFKRVIVDYLFNGTARVTWEYSQHFHDPLPYTLQLQYSQSSGIPTADDWVSIGTAQTNVIVLTDTDRRLYGKTVTLSYRIKLITSVATYYSESAEPLGKFKKFDWLMSREIIRKESLRHTTFASIPGWLLKAKRYGEKCTCVDPFTDEITDSNHELCHGTGIISGFYAPVPASYLDINVSSAREHRDLQAVGTEKKQSATGRFLGQFELVQGDAFVCDGSDERYYLHSIKELAIWKGVPLVVEAELRLAPFTDAVYKVTVPDS